MTEINDGSKYFPASPKGASVPSLGLSNKAVYDDSMPAAKDRHIKDEYPDNYFVPVTMDGTMTQFQFTKP